MAAGAEARVPPLCLAESVGISGGKSPQQRQCKVGMMLFEAVLPRHLRVVGCILS